MANDKALQVQGESIDTGKPEKIIWEEIDLPQEIKLPPKQSIESNAEYTRKEASLQNYYSASQTQGEFKNWDEDLDKGIRSGDSQNEVRAQNQDAWGELGTGLVKMGTEVSLGTLSATALIPQTVAQLLGAQKDYSNTVSEALDSYKADLNEQYGKTYIQEKNQGFAPLSWEYWTNNAGSVATTLSLMIPTWGFTEALGAGARALKLEQGVMALARGAKETSILSRASKWAISVPGKQVMTGLAAAAFSRNVESTMEASQTYKETEGMFVEDQLQDGTKVYKLNSQTGQRFTEQEVKQFAGEAAASNYKKNWLMIAQDYMQYSNLFKTFDMARRTSEVLKGAERGVLKSALHTVGEKTLDAAGEAVEEGYQYITNKESVDTQLVKAGLRKERDWTDRYGEYFTDAEFKSSVLQGAVGAGIFQVFGSLQGRGIKKQQEENRKAIEKIHQTHDASMVGDITSFESKKYEAFVDSAIAKAEQGSVDLIETDLDYLKNDADANIEAQGYNPKEYRESVSKAQEITSKVATEYNKLSADPTIAPVLVPSLTKAKMDIHLAEDMLPTIASAREELFKKDQATFISENATLAQSFLDLKKLMISSEYNTSKEAQAQAEGIVKDINARSTKYNTAEKVLDVIDTVQTEGLQKLSERETQLNDLKVSAKKFIADMKDPLNQKAFIEKQQEKVKSKDVADKLEEEGIVEAKDKKIVADAAEILTEKAKIENPEASAEEIQEIVAAELTELLSPKEEAVESAPVGEYVVGDKLKLGTYKSTYTVVSTDNGEVMVTSPAFPVPTNLETLRRNIAAGDALPEISLLAERPAKEVVGNTPANVIVENTIETLFESPTAVDVVDEIPAKVEASVTIENTASTTEFTNNNWRVSKDKEGSGFNLHLTSAGELPGVNPTTAKELSGEYKIDYQAQSAPLHNPESVTLKAFYVTTTKGEVVKSILIINRENKVLGQVGKLSGVDFNALHEELVINGNASATLNNKTTDFTKNLANVKVTTPGAQQYKKGLVTFFEDCPEFMPKEDIWIGTCDNEQGKINYYNSKGEVFSSSELSVPGLTQEQKQIGPTFMLMYDPGGNLVPIFLQDTKMKDAKIDGKSLSEVIQKELSASLMTIQEEVNVAVAQGADIKDIRDNYAEWNKPFHEVAYTHLRNVPEFKKDKTTPDKNHFQLDVVFPLNDPASTTLSIRVSYKADGATKRSTDPNIVSAVIGERLYGITTGGLARQDGSQVKLILDNNLVTTDIYSKRPWINPILKLTLNERTEIELASKDEVIVEEKPVVVEVVAKSDKVEAQSITSGEDLSKGINFSVPKRKGKGVYVAPISVSSTSEVSKEDPTSDVNANVSDLSGVVNPTILNDVAKDLTIEGDC